MLVTNDVAGFVQVMTPLPPPAEVKNCPEVPAVVGKLKLYVPAADCGKIEIVPELDPVNK